MGRQVYLTQMALVGVPRDVLNSNYPPIRLNLQMAQLSAYIICSPFLSRTAVRSSIRFKNIARRV